MIRKYLTETEFENLNGVYNSNVDYVVVDEENSPKKVVFKTNNLDGGVAIFNIEDEYPTPTGAISITENGENIDVKEYATANVNVPQPTGVVTIIANATGIDVAQYATADVNVPNPSTGSLEITTNDTYDVSNYASVVVNVQ